MCLRCVFDGCAALKVGIENHQNIRISQTTYENIWEWEYCCMIWELEMGKHQLMNITG